MRTDRGHLEVRTFAGFDSLVEASSSTERFEDLKESHEDQVTVDDGSIRLRCERGLQIHLIPESFWCFRLRVKATMLSEGKFGIVFRLNRETHDGYYLSLDLFKGVAQLRSWGSGPDDSGRDIMQFQHCSQIIEKR